jgi:hypothetical protein
MSFWQGLAIYCDALAPVSGPRLTAVSHTAAAVDQAERKTRELDANTIEINALLTESED